MRWLFVVCLLVYHIFGMTQNPVDSDSSLVHLANGLPSGWTMELKGKELILSRSDSAWVAHGNWHRASLEHFRLKSDSNWVKTEGKKTRIYKSFILVPQMNAKEIKEYRKHNSNYSGPYGKAIFNSENHTLFESRTVGQDDFENAVWPPTASEELYSIERLLRQFFQPMN